MPWRVVLVLVSCAGVPQANPISGPPPPEPPAAKPAPSTGPQAAIVIAARGTDSGLLDAMSKRCRSGVGAFEIRLAGDPARRVPGRCRRAGADLENVAGHDDAQLLAIVASEGIGIKTNRGNVAPGCVDAGPGITVPLREGRLDVPSAESCLRKLRAAFPGSRGLTLLPTDAVTFDELLRVFESLRDARPPLFEEILIEVRFR